jgi:hypothetical protein
MGTSNNCANQIFYTLNLELDACVGLENVAYQDPIGKIYPNPNNGKFVLETGVPESVSVTVNDVTGKKIWSGVVSGQGTIDLANVPTGIYSLRISSDHSVQYRKLVKQ